MTLSSRQLLAVLAAAAAFAAAGCGSDDEPEGEELPRATVSELEKRLDEIARRYSDARDKDNPGACEDIESDSFPAITDLLSGLPDDVDPDVRQATEDSFSRLRELTSEGCSEVEPAETETVPPETEVETVPPPPPPTETETTPPETEPEPPPDEGKGNRNNGNGNGNNGNGNGNGGGAAPDQGGGGGLQAPQPGGE